MKKYPASIIVLHWLTVILVAIVAYKGFHLEDYEFNAANFSKFRNHALLGILILIITLVRFYLIKKHQNNLPQLHYYSNFHRLVVNAVHAMIYTLLILIPIVGFLNVLQTGAFGYCFGKEFPEGAQLNDTLHEMHEILAWFLFFLIAAHVLGVLMYMIKTKEKLIKRMCLLAK